MVQFGDIFADCTHTHTHTHNHFTAFLEFVRDYPCEQVLERKNQEG